MDRPEHVKLQIRGSGPSSPAFGMWEVGALRDEETKVRAGDSKMPAVG